MHGIYQFKIEGYGIYVSQSYNPAESIVKQIDILSKGTHHSLPLQKLWNMFPELFSYNIVSIVQSESLLNIAGQAYRKQFPFVLDSPYQSKLVENNRISRRYSLGNMMLVIEVDPHFFAHIYNDRMQKLGIEVANTNLVSGFYRTLFNGKGPIKRIIRDGIPT